MNDSYQKEEHVLFSDVIAILRRKKIGILVILVIGISLSFGFAFFISRNYVASTLVLPPQQQQSSATNALAQLGALAGVVGGGAAVKSSENMYIAFMKTRRLQDALIDRYNLKARYGASTYHVARQHLNNFVSIASDKKSGLISIEVEDHDAEFAAKLANSYVEELRKMLLIIAVTDAQQRRVFFEAQVNKTKEFLNQAEVSFRTEQKKSGLVVSQSLAESGVKEAAIIKAQIASKEVQLQIVERFATVKNPEYQRNMAEISALRKQLSILENGTNSSENPIHNGTSTKAVQAFRDMKVQEALLELFIRQLEAARADESREAPLLQQVDVATPPELPTKPKRSFVLLVGLLLSLAAAALYITVSVILTDGKQRAIN